MSVHQTCHTSLKALIIALVLLAGLTSPVGANDRRALENAPVVALLSPRDGTVVSGPILRVQALVAAFKPHPIKSFIFDGATVAGKNAGRVSYVEIAVDGVVMETVEHHACRRRMLADSRINLSGLAPGQHTVTVTAYQGDHHSGIGRSVTAAFTLDPTLAVAERNRIEEAATPTPFACLVLRGEDDDDDDGRPPRRLELEGRIVPGKHSDGIDPTRDRVVVALGSRVVVIEPAKLICKRNRCRFIDRHHPVVQRLELEAKGDGSWKVGLYGDPLPPDSSTVFVRIGNDWGGLDLATGEAMIRLRSPLDESRRAQATIGPAGGTVETSDATGVVIRLHVPAGALARPTPLTMTPVASSSVPDLSRALHPGVKLEPEGLVFVVPATLELDFAATDRPLTPTMSAFVLTSPLTTLPLFGHVDVAARVLTARLRHFTELQAGQANPAFIDLQAWADPILREKGLMTLSELETSAQTYGEGQLGCGGSGEQACASLEELSSRAADSLRTLADAACQDGDASPSLLVVDRLVGLEDIAQRLTVDTVIPGFRTCMERILRALIEAAGTAAMADPEPPYDDTNDPMLAILLDSPEAVCMITLKDYARCLGFRELEQLALDKVMAALRTRIENAGAEARVVPSEAHLQRLVTLGLVTEQLGRFDLMTLAHEQLSSALRALVAQAQQTCRNDVAFGRLLLDRAWAFAPAVSAVDPALAGDIDRVRTNCIAIPRVNFLGTYGGAYELSVVSEPLPRVSVVYDNSQGRWSDGPGARISIRTGVGVGVYRIEVCAFGECPGGSSFFDGPYGLFQVTATQNALSGQEIAQQRWNGFTFVPFTRNRTISATLEGDTLTGRVIYPSGAVETFRVTRPFRSIQPTVDVCSNFFLVVCNP